MDKNHILFSLENILLSKSYQDILPLLKDLTPGEISEILLNNKIKNTLTETFNIGYSEKLFLDLGISVISLKIKSFDTTPDLISFIKNHITSLTKLVEKL